MDTSSFILSSNGANDLSSNNITSDNISVLSSLSVAGNNILSSLSTLNTNINNINSFAGSTASGLNITASTQINFNVSSYSLTNINASGLSVFTSGRTTFPFTYAGWYNISERLDNLVCVMQDTALPIITYDADNNTTLRIRQADFYSSQYPQKNYPKQIQFCDFFNKKVGYFNTSGLNILDVNGNYNNISSYFTQTGNSLLLCSNKTMIDAGGNLNVYEMTTYTTLGIITGTGGTWLNVADTLNSNTSNITTLSNSYNTVLSQLSTISGNVANIANIANYYSGLQSSLAVTNGVVSGSGLVLAFNLKEDRYDAQYPLYKRAPIPLSGESFNQLSLKYNGALAMDSSNNLTINTSGFLTPSYGDLGLLATPNGISSTSSSYVVVGRISQPMTCSSLLNVSGYTTLNNNTTINSSLNVSGYTTLNNKITCTSSLNVSGYTTLNNNTTVIGSLNVSGTFMVGTINATSQFVFAVSDGFSWLGTSYNVYDTHISLFKNGSANYSINRGTANSHLFGDTSGTAYLNLNGTNNYSNNPFIMASTLTVSGNTAMNSNLNVNASLTVSGNTVMNSNLNVNASLTVSGNTVMNSNLNVNANIYANNLSNKTPFLISVMNPGNINNTAYYRYDLDLRYYTTYINTSGVLTRIFKFMCWLQSGNHINQTGVFSLNYDINYSQVSGGYINALAYGFPSSNNMSMDQVTSNNLFLWKNTFNYMSIFCLYPADLQCLIIDYI